MCNFVFKWKLGSFSNTIKLDLIEFGEPPEARYGQIRVGNNLASGQARRWTSCPRMNAKGSVEPEKE